PAVSTASSAWIAGPRADAPFYVSMIAVGAIVAAVFDRGVVTASGASELAGFAVVQFHREPAGHALVMTLLAAMAMSLALGLIYAIARDLRSHRRELQTLIDQMPGVVFRFDVLRREMLYVG